MGSCSTPVMPLFFVRLEFQSVPIRSRDSKPDKAGLRGSCSPRAHLMSGPACF
jgi:hypothetical protein